MAWLGSTLLGLVCQHVHMQVVPKPNGGAHTVCFDSGAYTSLRTGEAPRGFNSQTDFWRCTRTHTQAEAEAFPANKGSLKAASETQCPLKFWLSATTSKMLHTVGKQARWALQPRSRIDDVRYNGFVGHMHCSCNLSVPQRSSKPFCLLLSCFGS